MGKLVFAFIYGILFPQGQFSRAMDASEMSAEYTVAGPQRGAFFSVKVLKTF